MRKSILDVKIKSFEIVISTINPMLGSTTLIIPVVFE